MQEYQGQLVSELPFNNKEKPMSFQAYLDKVEELTGKTPKEFVAEAKKKNLTTHKEIMAWLKTDYGLGTGHARAIAHVILHGPEFTVKQTTGTHRDETGTLNLDGKKSAKTKPAKKKSTTAKSPKAKTTKKKTA